MPQSPVEVVFNASCLLGECPVWDGKRNVICWVDIMNGQIHQYSTESNTHWTIYLDQMIGAISLSSNGDFLGAMKNGFAFIDKKDGTVKPIVDPEAHLPENRFNDGKVDPFGRFWAGTLAFSEDEGKGSVYVLEKDLTFSKKIDHVTISNGLAWSPDHKTFYYIDTPTHEIVAYDYDKSTGAISRKRSVIRFDGERGYPDGMTIDAEGMLWIAHWDGWQITRWNPLTGKKILSIALPVARVTSCTFGGENLEDIFITSARKELSEEELLKQPLAGSLFVVKRSGFKGLPTVEFTGTLS